MKFWSLSRAICLTIITGLSIFGQNTVGLIQGSPNASPGYTLFTPNKSHSTFLIDNNGLLIKQWDSNYNPTLTAYLLEDGSLLRATALPSEGSSRKGGFQKYSWDGVLLWEFAQATQHHDIEPLPNGNVLLVVNAAKTPNDALAAGFDSSRIPTNGVRSLSIFEVERVGSDSGRVVWKWHAWDHLIQDLDGTKANFGVVQDHPELIDANHGGTGSEAWLHTNSVDYNAGFDQLLVSNRSTNEIWVIDHSTSVEEAASHSGGNQGKGGDLLYRWGNPENYRAGTSVDQQLFAQHDARWIPDSYPGGGNITVFSNGLGRIENDLTSIEEISPPVDLNGNYQLLPDSAYMPAFPVWSYFSDTTVYKFQSPRYGGAERLSNGNTLICSPLDGRFFEVTPDSEIVWIYINPVDEIGILTQGETPTLNAVFRCNRYTPDYPGFVGKDLTPGNPIELAVQTSVKNINIPTDPVLYGNYPNPFNPITTISYDLQQQSQVKLTVFDIKGIEVETLTASDQTPGSYKVQWNGLDHAGNPVSTGVYFCRLKAGEYTNTIKMLYLK